MMTVMKNILTGIERGATLIEYVLFAAILVIAIIAIMPATEKNVACRVNTGKAHYQEYDIADPGAGDPRGPCITPP